MKMNRLLLASSTTTSLSGASAFITKRASSSRPTAAAVVGAFRSFPITQHQQREFHSSVSFQSSSPLLLSSSSNPNPSNNYYRPTTEQRMMSNKTTNKKTTTTSSPYKPPSWLDIQDYLAKTSKTRPSSLFEGPHVEMAITSLLTADAVCFDVDSTVITEEGIDVLADYLGKGAQVKELTKRAMEGNNLTFDKALQLRLDLLQPNLQQIQQLLQERPLELTPGVEDLMHTLQEHGVDVFLVSGGFRIMIEPVAKQLCIAKDRIVANTLLFDEATGAYTGFDPNEPTSADMGKRKALQQIKDENEYEVMIMIGDGATDAQAKPPADAFIGFGGVVVREPVKQLADCFVTSFEPLTALVKQFGRNKLHWTE